jgi:sugar phosphate isomerase/epimerase
LVDRIGRVEIGTGAYAAPKDSSSNTHIDLEHLLSDKAARDVYLHEIAKRGMIISALSCHGNPIHPDTNIADHDDEIFRKTVRLVIALNIRK